MVRVKICGITNKRDAWAAVDAGADAVGFMLYSRSPRAVSAAVARSIIRTLPQFVVPVAVLVNRSVRETERLVSACGFGLVQLHGEESPQVVRSISVPVMKVLRIATRRDLGRLRRYRPAMFLLDSYEDGRRGGTGRRIVSEALRGLRLKVPFFLAGGLNHGNVRQAVKMIRPFGVDASSGVERRPGSKDHSLLKKFIRAAKAA